MCLDTNINLLPDEYSINGNSTNANTDTNTVAYAERDWSNEQKIYRTNS